MVEDLMPGVRGSYPAWKRSLAGALYFTAGSPRLGRELRRVPTG